MARSRPKAIRMIALGIRKPVRQKRLGVQGFEFLFKVRTVPIVSIVVPVFGSSLL